MYLLPKVSLSISISISIFSKFTDISTIDIDISSKKHEKTLISAEKNGFFTQNVLIDIDIDIDIFKSDLIDIDIFKTCQYIDNQYGLSIY